MKFGFSPDEYRSSPPVTPSTPLTKLIENSVIGTGVLDTPLDYALRYAALGWYVLPVRADKKPLEGYGLNSATRDPEIIRTIWGTHPTVNIAVACEASGLVVMDIDPRNDGWDTVSALEAEHGQLRSAVTATTQGGGQHRFFKASPHAAYPGTLGAGIDLKHRGYVLVEPSQGLQGVYRWVEDKDPTQGSTPDEAPQAFHSRAQSTELSTRTRPGSVIVAPEVYAEIRAALIAIPPDSEYGTWFKVLQGLSRLSDSTQAYELARAWSTGSRKTGHTEAALKDKWRTCMRESYTVNYTSVFFMADSNSRDWRNAVAVVTTPDHPLSFTHALTSGAGTVTAFEYVYDRFMSTGVNVVAGAPGVGKTTLVIPLALAAAHLCPHDHPLKPRVRRNVIIITESVVQVQRVIYSLAQWGYTGLSAADFDRHVKVIPALRLDPKVVAGVAEHYSGWTVDNPKADGTAHAALPLVVLDTANAVLELENENDNAEVGRAMALIKQSFSAFPLIIVAHTSKVMGTGETDGLSPRGASAWTGDAQGVYTVFKDGEHPDSPRVLKATKVRFPTAYPELIFELVSHKEAHPNILGEMEEEWFAHSIARPLKAGERIQLKEDNKELKQLDDWITLCDEMLDLVRTQPERSRTYYEQLPKTKGGPRGAQERKERAMASLINDGCIKIVMLDKPKGRSDHYLRVDEEIVAAVNKGRYGV